LLLRIRIESPARAANNRFPEGFPSRDGRGRSRKQIPAAPLVIASYAFFLLLMIFYLVDDFWRRIGKSSKARCRPREAGQAGKQ